MAEVVFDNVPEDVLHATVEFWHFKEGDHIDEGEDLVDLRSPDGDTFTIASPVSGILTERLYSEEDEVEIGEVLAEIDEDTDVFDDDIDLEDFDDEDHEDEEEELEEGIDEEIDEDIEEELEEEEDEEYDEEEDY